MLPTTIDGVINELDRTIAEARREASRLGYFPALYRKVTLSVKQGIADGRFEDGKRMERLDVIFANRYLQAIAKLRAGEAPTRSWAIAFDAAASTVSHLTTANVELTGSVNKGETWALTVTRSMRVCSLDLVFPGL